MKSIWIYPKCDCCGEEKRGDDRMFDLSAFGWSGIICEDCLEGEKVYAEDLTIEREVPYGRW
jgi:hypothetical protein